MEEGLHSGVNVVRCVGGGGEHPVMGYLSLEGSRKKVRLTLSTELTAGLQAGSSGL
jgi:hypothetical protein